MPVDVQGNHPNRSPSAASARLAVDGGKQTESSGHAPGDLFAADRQGEFLAMILHELQDPLGSIFAGVAFVRDLEFSRDAFLRNAVRRASNFRGRKDKGNGLWHAHLEGLEISPRSAYRPALSEEDIRIHAWLNERLAALHHERRGLWSKIGRFLFGN
jgi:hypothetical protein